MVQKYNKSHLVSSDLQMYIYNKFYFLQLRYELRKSNVLFM